jgi:hypothetical protein
VIEKTVGSTVCPCKADHLHIVPSLIMSGAVPVLPHMSSWCVQGHGYFSSSVTFSRLVSNSVSSS